MKILIDADGCPVVQNTIAIAKEYNLDVIIICDTAHHFSIADVTIIVVDKGNDSVDFTLVNKVNTGDIVITQDYGLAAMALAKRAEVISQNGLIYTDENMDSLLHGRHIAKKIRNAGGRLSNQKKRTSEDDVNFEQALTQLIVKSHVEQ